MKPSGSVEYRRTEIGSESDEEFFMLPSWTNHVTELEYYQWLRTPQRFEAKSTTHRTINREAESWDKE